VTKTKIFAEEGKRDNARASKFWRKPGGNMKLKTTKARPTILPAAKVRSSYRRYVLGILNGLQCTVEVEKPRWLS
jgi:hypothetical protein